MKQSKLFYLVLPFIVLAIPWAYLAFVWNELPQTIATHFGIDGTPDKFGKKTEIIFGPLIVSIVGLLTYFLLRNIHKIDPKKKYTEKNASLMRKLSVVMLIFLSFISIFIIYSSLVGKIAGISLMLCGLGLFFAYIGNLLHSIKPNYFAGFRIPWALENEDNWRKTHQLASKVWFIGGLLLAFLSLILTTKILFIVFFVVVSIMTIVPILFSYNHFRKRQRNT
ncbi:MAG: SdpI family protein [Chitinophagaceae bacterium]|nr:SdpI family protein [Chitinophagaceae bacterium]